MVHAATTEFHQAQAEVLVYTMERLPDVLDGEEVLLSAALRTDGEFCWRSDLAHYVEKYGMSLPAEFLLHAEGNSWAPPFLSDDACDELVRLYIKGP